MYFDDMDIVKYRGTRKLGLTNHSEGDMLSFQLEQIIE